MSSRIPADQSTGSVRATPSPNDKSELIAVREIADFDFEGRGDIRGSRVLSSDSQLVGVVDALFADRHTKALRYLGVTLVTSVDLSRGGSAGAVLVPVGAASRPGDQRAVVLRSLSAKQLESAPRILNRSFDRADEIATLVAYGMATSTDAAAPAEYEGPHFDERRLFATSGIERGA